MDTIKAMIRGIENPRDQLMVKIMYNSGIRNKECTRLRIEHINYKTETNFDHWVKKGKGFNGGKDRRFYLPPFLLMKIK
jgi:integrase